MREKNADKTEIVARAVVVRNGKFLLCRLKGAGHFFLPGGENEFGELSKAAIIREMKEETGSRFTPRRIIGIGENIYGKNGNQYHEVNIIYEGTLAGSGMAKERHIEFVWVPVTKFARVKFLPKTMKQALMRWVRDKKPFWVSEHNAS
ncbi:MAG: NUDIX domain-containing protein [Candidatus Sungbacteria bacterium]|nr:NUDIX domain-containing protein [Candidatus Sungbacteria bacterium]